MNINQIIVNTMAVFMLVAVVDRIMGNHLRLGGKIEQGLETMVALFIPITGMMVLSPAIGQTLSVFISPLYRCIGADPAIFANSLFACDMGGYSLAYAIADTPEGAQFSSCILGTMLGGVITFMIPVGLNIVRKEYKPYFAIGIMIGVISIPFGMICGGIVAGYSYEMIFRNTIPVVMLAIILTFGLYNAQELCARVFMAFGKVINVTSAIGFAIGIVQEITPWCPFPSLPSIVDGIVVVGKIAIVLCGAFPLIEVINRVLISRIQSIGKRMGVDERCVTALLTSLASFMPVLGECNCMSPAGVVVALAFSVGSNCMFGDYLGFIASLDAEMIVPMLIGKISAALLALWIAMLFCRKRKISSSPAINA